jgi:hypothetical protein
VIGGRNSVPMNKTSRQFSARARRKKRPACPIGDPVMRIAFDHRGVGPALEAEHHRTPAAARHGVGDRAGKAAAAADDRKRIARALCVSHGAGSSGCIVVLRIGWLFCARPHQRTLAAGANERNDFADQGIAGKLALDRLEPIRDTPLDEKQRAIGPAQPVHLVLGRAAPAQADDIQSDQRRGLAERKSEGDYVVAGGRHSRHHDAFADAHELMDGDVAAEECVIADADMTAKHDIIGKGHVVADLAIVSDMRTRP